MTERNLRLVLEYDGSGFSGWQFQPGLRTVQGELRAALKRLLGRPVLPAGAGRTDAGVHAEGQIASFKTTSPLPTERILRSLNGLTGADLVVLSVEEAPPEFHARFSAIERHYRYRFLDGPSALHRLRAWWPRRALRTAPMEAASRHLRGEHPFDAFAAAEARGGPKICHVLSTSWERWERGWEFHIAADRFLHHMVRNIVGTLVEIGAGKRRPEAIPELIARRDRSRAGPTAPACGLTLLRVSYPSAGAEGHAVASDWRT